MTINKLNYEVYAIDYLDGNLTGELLEEMEQFLLMNPEIAKEVDMFNSMVFISDQSIEYLGKNDMKKPLQFSILNYMNWIVPICMSITFMAVYPYIREYWITGNDLQPTHQPVKEVPYSQPKENTVQLDESIPISAVTKNSNSKNVSSTVNSFVPKPKIRNRNVATNNYRQEKVNTPQTISTKNNVVVEDAHWDEEEKSTVDFFGKKTLNFNKTQADLSLGDEVAMYPNELETNYDLEDYNDKVFDGIGKPTPYLSLSFTPFGIGHDIAKTTNIETQFLIRDLPIDENSDIVLENPIHVGIGASMHLSKNVAVETGYYATKRNIAYYPFTSDTQEKIKTNIRYLSHSIPVNAVLALPFFKNSNQLNVRIGAAINWMGSRNYTSIENGSLADEVAKTATIIKAPDVKLVTTNDDLKFVPVMQFGFEYAKDINYGNIAFAVTYNRQMGNINHINVWDYNLVREERIGEPEIFNMRYETIMASVKYTLPNRWYLEKK